MDRSGLVQQDVFRPSSSVDDEMSTSPTSVRRQKLDQQRALMQQRQKMRQAQQGMMLNRGLQRPVSAGTVQSGYFSSSSRPMSAGFGSTGSSASSIGSSFGSSSFSSSGGGGLRLGSAGDTAGLSSFRNSSTSSGGSAFDSRAQRAGTGNTSTKSWLDDLGTDMPSASSQKQTDTERKLAAQSLLSTVDYSESIEEPEELVLSSGGAMASATSPGPDSDEDNEPEGGGRGAVAPVIPDTQRRSSVPRLDPIGSPADMPLVDVKNIADFVLRPAPQNVTVRCRVTRKDANTFLMHLEQPNNQLVFLLAARKRKKRPINYILSMDSTDLSRKGHSFIGKLRANFLGTEFTIYDNGVNPRKGEALPDGSNARQELAAVVYERNVLGMNGPRKMTVLAPGMSQNDERVVVKPTSEAETIVERYRANKLQNLIELHNKEPQWNPDTESFVLNFYGRVLKASVKNFQVVHLDDIDYIIMQFGRINNDQFSLDYSYPFCALQAFGIALSSCADKLACE